MDEGLDGGDAGGGLCGGVGLAQGCRQVNETGSLKGLLEWYENVCNIFPLFDVCVLFLWEF